MRIIGLFFVWLWYQYRWPLLAGLAVIAALMYWQFYRPVPPLPPLSTQTLASYLNNERFPTFFFGTYDGEPLSLSLDDFEVVSDTKAHFQCRLRLVSGDRVFYERGQGTLHLQPPSIDLPYLGSGRVAVHHDTLYFQADTWNLHAF